MKNTPVQMWNPVFIEPQDPQQSAVEGSIRSLLYLLDSTRSFKATDDRDKIFSLLGICDEGIQPVSALTRIERETGWCIDAAWQGLIRFIYLLNRLHPSPNSDMMQHTALKPDYNRDTVSVYCGLTRFLMRAPPHVLNVLSHVQHDADPSSGPFPS